jgi:hypothetical protein
MLPVTGCSYQFSKIRSMNSFKNVVNGKGEADKLTWYHNAIFLYKRKVGKKSMCLFERDI